MPVTLCGLPYDIRHSILRQVDDRSTLLNLILTSTAFHEIFRHYKEGIINNLYLSEALNHGPDALVFAYCRRTALDIEDIGTLVDVVQSYGKYTATGAYPVFLATPYGSYEPQKLGKYLVDDYLGIRKIAITHQYSTRLARKEPALTSSEVRRIVQSIYRGWTLLLLIHQRQAILAQNPSLKTGTTCKYDQYFIERIIISWDIWSSLQIWELIGEHLRVLPTGTVDVRNARAFQQFNDDIKVSLLQPAFDGYPEKQALTLIFPVFRRVDSQPFTEANFALAHEFAEYLFIYHDPATIAPLYTLEPTPSPKVAYDRIGTYLTEPVKSYLSLKYSLSPADFVSQYSLDSFRILRGMISKLKLEKFYRPNSQERDFYDRVTYEGVVPAMRLLEKPGKQESNKVFEKRARMVNAASWIRKAWLCNCLLDEWRLEQRGFEFPVFEDD
ncbi:hypothetical protein H072_11576 [Dactylellina haptotyla CBS 200.50]|uniref:F-box domain-containing protein n=1 Tax=Dactylellina haptotyla (strain CBS 200.50) TaxID=1284197 RepID=S7ZWE9_DACHA|nr:hypothetical protein H072_11576 [Dactylellina haptotyla CBS 200.50]